LTKHLQRRKNCVRYFVSAAAAAAAVVIVPKEKHVMNQVNVSKLGEVEYEI
jgi:cobalamin biosynthesis protein CbiD